MSKVTIGWRSASEAIHSVQIPAEAPMLSRGWTFEEQGGAANQQRELHEVAHDSSRARKCKAAGKVERNV